MEKLLVTGGRPIAGEVSISGAKNSALPMIAATLLSEDQSVVERIPWVQDVQTMIDLVRSLGAIVATQPNSVAVRPGRVTSSFAPREIVNKMRASFCVLGPLLARTGQAKVPLPGGCTIGPRPVDLHLKGFRALGAEIEVQNGYVVAHAQNGLVGAEIDLTGQFGSSVLATANVLMAATLARGQTTIHRAACEPEIGDLVRFLQKMGADIQRAGSECLTIRGVKSLKGIRYSIIDDRIEAGTFMLATAIAGGEVTIRNVDPRHHDALIRHLLRMGVTIDVRDTSVRVRRDSELKATKLNTDVYPGFPTDLQPQMISLFATTPGVCCITEKVFIERFKQVPALKRMGAQIDVTGAVASVRGVRRLQGASVTASDLRACASLALAALAAEGTTEIYGVEHLDRGYERFEQKLAALGAEIRREQA